MDNQSPELFGQTPWQTVGPFFHYALPWKGGADLAGQSDMGARPELMPPANYLLKESAPRGEVKGEVILVEGVVRDASGEPVVDAMIEIWQADAFGRYPGAGDGRNTPTPDAAFVGFGRAATDEEGRYRFRTVRPGATPGPDGATQAPHIAVGVFGRGLLKRLVTRLYFDGEASNANDPVLALTPAERRDTLIARRDGGAWRFDIVLQGEGETVFFDV